MWCPDRLIQQYSKISCRCTLEFTNCCSCASSRCWSTPSGKLRLPLNSSMPMRMNASDRRHEFAKASISFRSSDLSSSLAPVNLYCSRLKSSAVLSSSFSGASTRTESIVDLCYVVYADLTRQSANNGAEPQRWRKCVELWRTRYTVVVPSTLWSVAPIENTPTRYTASLIARGSVGATPAPRGQAAWLLGQCNYENAVSPARTRAYTQMDVISHHTHENAERCGRGRPNAY